MQVRGGGARSRERRSGSARSGAGWGKEGERDLPGTENQMKGHGLDGARLGQGL